MNELTILDDLKNLLPPLTDTEYAGLEADILERGCLSPLVVWNDTIVDGHHRYSICRKYNIPFEIKPLEFLSWDDAKLWAWSHQENRRNLTAFQRAEIALQFKSLFAARAKENMSIGGGDKKSEQAKSGWENSPHPISEKNTRQEIAKIANVSDNTVSRVEYLHDHADAETKEKLRQGKTSINKEYTRLRVAKEGETSDFDPKPLTPIYPNGIGEFKERVTLQYILLHETESLVDCLFSIFDAAYREQLILDMLEKARIDNGEETVRQIVQRIKERF
ncbi:MAG: hypothetical protein LBT05_04825 [Planctomycetaceae bacterium]|jgi:hypothetical protein|nr:hypothetical protein [Planctomycetaceae bacterium]